MVKIKICKEENCNNSATTKGYCRLHYLKNWRKVKSIEQKTAADKLNKYVERIVEKHPDKYVEAIKKDLRSRTFQKRIEEEYGASDIDDVYEIFNDPGYEGDVENLIKNLKLEDKF